VLVAPELLALDSRLEPVLELERVLRLPIH
jgi:hypothetical protein